MRWKKNKSKSRKTKTRRRGHSYIGSLFARNKWTRQQRAGTVALFSLSLSLSFLSLFHSMIIFLVAVTFLQTFVWINNSTDNLSLSLFFLLPAQPPLHQPLMHPSSPSFISFFFFLFPLLPSLLNTLQYSMQIFIWNVHQNPSLVPHTSRWNSRYFIHFASWSCYMRYSIRCNSMHPSAFNLQSLLTATLILFALTVPPLNPAKPSSQINPSHSSWLFFHI